MSILGILTVLVVLSISTTIGPASATMISAPLPIPGNLVPQAGTGSLGIPLPLPNLGIVSIPSLPLSPYSVDQVQTGLVVSDSLTNETKTQQQLQTNPGYWRYGGDAPAEKAPYTFWKDIQGLHIGVQSPANGTWAGYYAVTQDTKAMLFHSVITTPDQTIPSKSNWYENGMYVQNGTANVSYVVCTSNTSIVGTQWVVASVQGNAFGATSENVLWASPMTLTEPTTRDCTIITNGTNYLKVILDGVQVYENNNLNLGMTHTPVTFLEPQTNYAGQLLSGSYKNFFVTSDVNVKVTNNPSLAARVDLVEPTSSSTGQVVASAPVDSSGTATLDIENIPMPLQAYIQVYTSSGIELATTKSPVSLYGGDVYSVDLKSGLNLLG
ncbi:hypothetical protein [Candidatus Nitrosotalea okcheonensis]|nr:hypothetical protein [Candidatus Nitrosotalea okcheonensis]